MSFFGRSIANLRRRFFGVPSTQSTTVRYPSLVFGPLSRDDPRFLRIEAWGSLTPLSITAAVNRFRDVAGLWPDRIKVNPGDLARLKADILPPGTVASDPYLVIDNVRIAGNFELEHDEWLIEVNRPPADACRTARV